MKAQSTFFFTLVFICWVGMIFSLVRQIKSPTYKAGILQYTKTVTERMQ